MSNMRIDFTCKTLFNTQYPRESRMNLYSLCFLDVLTLHPSLLRNACIGYKINGLTRSPERYADQVFFQAAITCTCTSSGIVCYHITKFKVISGNTFAPPPPPPPPPPIMDSSSFPVVMYLLYNSPQVTPGKPPLISYPPLFFNLKSY